MKIKPANDRILALVTGLTALGEKESKIILPDQVKEKQIIQAIVYEVGPKVNDELKPEIKNGSVVLVNVFAGTRLKVNDDELILFAAREVLAVVDMEVTT